LNCTYSISTLLILCIKDIWLILYSLFGLLILWKSSNKLNYYEDISKQIILHYFYHKVMESSKHMWIYLKHMHFWTLTFDTYFKVSVEFFNHQTVNIHTRKTMSQIFYDWLWQTEMKVIKSYNMIRENSIQFVLIYMQT
jgi:hypothetical protein